MKINVKLNTTFKNCRKARCQTPNVIDKWNCRPEIFSVSRALAISSQYLLLQTAGLQEKKPPSLGSLDKVDSFYSQPTVNKGNE